MLFLVVVMSSKFGNHQSKFDISSQTLWHAKAGQHTIFELNTSNGEWNDPWDLEPGTVGTAAGEKHGSGGVTVAFRELPPTEYNLENQRTNSQRIAKQGPLTDVCSIQTHSLFQS